jgi:hypothetical protein
LQPDGPLAGFKAVRNGYAEKLIMNLVFFIPITAIVMGIGIGMLGMWTDHKRKSQILEQSHRERMAAIERGVELPPVPSTSILEASQSAKSSPNPAKILRSGVFMLSLGIVLYFALITVGAAEAAVFGLIPGTIGLANLAYAAVLFDKERKAESLKNQDRLPPL